MSKQAGNDPRSWISAAKTSVIILDTSSLPASATEGIQHRMTLFYWNYSKKST